MKVIYNNIIPFNGYVAINLFGVIFARKEYAPLSEKAIRHEAIHTMQMKELGYLLFYVLYLIEWIIKLIIYGKEAYRNLSFEREAYIYENNPEDRKRFGWIEWF